MNMIVFVLSSEHKLIIISPCSHNLLNSDDLLTYIQKISSIQYMHLFERGLSLQNLASQKLSCIMIFFLL